MTKVYNKNCQIYNGPIKDSVFIMSPTGGKVTVKCEEKDGDIQNHFEEGCNCQIFDGPIKDSVFIMAPGGKVTVGHEGKKGGEG